MPLPFLSKKIREQGISTIIHRKPDENKEEPQDVDSVQYAAEDLLRAIEAKDPIGMAAAMRAAFEIMESEPHEEAGHEESEEEVE